jgi:ketosteroid isomerase-like protein
VPFIPAAAEEADMKSRMLWFVLFAFIPCLAQMGGDQDLQTAVTNANQAWSDAMRRGDAASMAGAYTNDAIYCGQDSQCATGRAAIEQQFRQRFLTLGRARTATAASSSVVRDRDLAYEWGLADVRFDRGTGLRGRYMTVWQRQPGGGWKIYRNLALPAQSFGFGGPQHDTTTTAAAAPVESYLLRCDSDDERRHTCAARGTIGRVELQRQISGSACVQNSTWGWSGDSVWVDRGCRAEFNVYAQAAEPVVEYNDTARTTTVKCESEDMSYRFCPAGGTVRSARLVRQISGSPCEETRTWGWKSDGVWVSKGCRAEFEVTTR